MIVYLQTAILHPIVFNKDELSFAANVNAFRGFLKLNS